MRSIRLGFVLKLIVLSDNGIVVMRSTDWRKGLGGAPKVRSHIHCVIQPERSEGEARSTAVFGNLPLIPLLP